MVDCQRGGVWLGRAKAAELTSSRGLAPYSRIVAEAQRASGPDPSWHQLRPSQASYILCMYLYISIDIYSILHTFFIVVTREPKNAEVPQNTVASTLFLGYAYKETPGCGHPKTTC